MSSTNQVAISDFNLEKINTRELGQHIYASSVLGSDVAIFGRRGSGKTEICKQQIVAAGFREVYLNLSVLERVDLGGYPDVMNSARVKEFINFLLPQFYEPMFDTTGKRVVLLLDEVDKADPSLWAPLLELVQFKSINGKQLPMLQSCLMTGNLISEGGARPSLPLLDRAEKYLVQADANQWIEWAGASGLIHPSVISYIQENGDEALFGEVDPDDRYADPSPRGWHGASKILYGGELAGMNPEMLIKKVAGRVGKMAGLTYATYYNHYQVLLPLVDKLFAGEDVYSEYKPLNPTKKLVAGIIIGTRLANRLDEAKAGNPHPELPTLLKRLGQWFQTVSPEDAFIVMRNQLQLKRIADHDLDEHEDWAAIVDDVNDKLKSSK